MRVTERPIGEINISPMITKAQLMINHNGLTLVSVPNKSPGNIIQIKESPAKNRPKENFIGYNDGTEVVYFGTIGIVTVVFGGLLLVLTPRIKKLMENIKALVTSSR